MLTLFIEIENYLQLAFWIIVPFILLIIIFLAIFIPLRIIYKTKYYRHYYYKKIHRIALDEDYFLINDFHFLVEDKTEATIDHILFANKYIYVINDYFYNGSLSGKEDDKSFVFTKKDGKKLYTENCLNISKFLIDRFSIITSINKDFMVGISLVNDKCDILLNKNDNQFFIKKRKELISFIKKIEQSNVANINQDELAKMVLAINEINLKNKKKDPK